MTKVRPSESKTFPLLAICVPISKCTDWPLDQQVVTWRSLHHHGSSSRIKSLKSQKGRHRTSGTIFFRDIWWSGEWRTFLLQFVSPYQIVETGIFACVTLFLNMSHIWTRCYLERGLKGDSSPRVTLKDQTVYNFKKGSLFSAIYYHRSKQMSKWRYVFCCKHTETNNTPCWLFLVYFIFKMENLGSFQLEKFFGWV